MLVCDSMSMRCSIPVNGAILYMTLWIFVLVLIQENCIFLTGLMSAIESLEASFLCIDSYVLIR